MKKYIILILSLSLGHSIAYTQTGDTWLAEVENKLSLLSEQGVALDQTVTIVMEGNIQEFVSLLAESTDLNIAIDPGINDPITVSFTSVKVRDIILHLCSTYELDTRLTGSIIYLIDRYIPPSIEPPKPLDVQYDSITDELMVNVQQTPLSDLTNEIAALSGQNIASSPNAREALISTYINKQPLESALQQIAASNELKLERTPDFFMYKTIEETALFRPSKLPDNQGSALSIQKTDADRVNIRAENVALLSVIQSVGDALELDYVFLAGIEVTPLSTGTGRNQTQRGGSPTLSIQLQNVSYEELLEQACKNSPYFYDTQDSIYLIGLREAEGLRETKVVPMQFRSARGVQHLIPPQMIKDVVIDSLFELNSLVLSGSEKNVEEIASFLASIDKAVPIVMIELTIIDVQMNQLDDYGIEAGVAPEGKDAGGTIIGESGTNFTFSTNAINNLLGLLGERGIINLGQVTPDFYVTLRALQETGIIDIKSTPRLSTLNSHPALLKIGQKRYYQEQQVNYPGYDRPVPVQAVVFREVEANLEVNINPMVSGDKEVTLEIGFEQSEFIGDTGPNAPPPQVSRRFDSIIRVKNGETIVLGGLERDARSNTRSGVPWLSKLPIIGWIFGRKRKNKQNEKLMIFIKPTVVD